MSAQKGGVLPLSQHSIFVLSNLSYHDYEGVALRDEEKHVSSPTSARTTTS